MDISKFDFLKSSEFEDCYRKQKHWKSSVDLDLLSWDDVIFCIDKATKYDSGMHILDNFGMIIHNVEQHPKIGAMLEQFSKLDPDYASDARWFISMVSTSECFPKHQDYYDVWYWQAIGEIDWKIWDNDKEYNYRLKPNDLVYIPHGMWHQTFSCIPRAGISFGINKKIKIR
jgi:hypothetical protein